MAATAHASVVSLMNTMDQIQSHPSLSTCFDIHQFQFLRQNVDFFLDFVENYSDADSNEAEDLVRRIAASAHEAEDKIEVEAADRMRRASTEKSRSRSTWKSLTFLFVLQRMIEDMNSIKEKVIKVKEETGLFTNSMPPPPPPPPSAAAPIATKKNNMVGFEGYMAQLLDDLTSLNSARRILPIVGMGGIGKTTLTRNAYENSVSLHHFDVRAWVTVSQDYDATQILLQALSCLGVSTNRNDVVEKLYKTLYGRRYLIVLDDVWSVEAWEEVQFSFPDNNNGSRIVVTTRQQQVVDYFASSALALNLLDEKNSWRLFCDETFGQEGCPPELEQEGRRIVEKCKGLPLAISVIGGLLGKSPRTREYWERVAKERSLALQGSSEGNQILSILYLSYKHLPVCLKSCFLYLGLFPEDHRIQESQLIQLLVAEGYIKANGKQTLEEVAESYVRELIDRNLLLVGKLRLNKELETCYLHDVVRELCISIAEKENFYCAQRCIDGTRHYIVYERTARSYPPQSPFAPKTPSVIAPKIVYGQRHAPFKSRLLRVSVDPIVLPDAFRECNLRYLCHEFSSYSRIPWSLSLCWSLQTLKLYAAGGTLPSEIWTMPQLRHIEVPFTMYLPDPPKSNNAIVLNNLQTLKRVEKLIFSKELCRRIPNIKHLKIKYNFVNGGRATPCFNLQNVGCLSKLETLRYECWGMEYVGNPVQNLTLPSSLRELTLSGCRLWWSDMAMLASLPLLQILELKNNAVVGAEWSCVEEKFCCLKHLKISQCDDLINWMAERSNFPVLETLDLRYLSKLKEIPSGIGEIDTLESIHLTYCSESATISVIKILEEQESLGNESLRVRLEIEQSKDEADRWREKYPIMRLLIPTYRDFVNFSSVAYDSIPKTS